jgi:amino-acid N-acetyltransferase
MDLRPRSATRADLPSVERLLEDAGLITAGVPAHIERFLLIEDAGRIIACAGLEQYGKHALLRSVAVIPAYRNRGVARLLVSRLLDEAAALRIEDVYLFTSTAPGYFRRFGFVPVARDDVAEPVRASEEYGECCSGAETMVLVLRSVDEEVSAQGADAARAQQ